MGLCPPPTPNANTHTHTSHPLGGAKSCVLILKRWGFRKRPVETPGLPSLTGFGLLACPREKAPEGRTQEKMGRQEEATP